MLENLPDIQAAARKHQANSLLPGQKTKPGTRPGLVDHVNGKIGSIFVVVTAVAGGGHKSIETAQQVFFAHAVERDLGIIGG